VYASGLIVINRTECVLYEDKSPDELCGQSSHWPQHSIIRKIGCLNYESPILEFDNRQRNISPAYLPFFIGSQQIKCVLHEDTSSDELCREFSH